MSDDLIRTVSGLANQHLFFGVDLLVYCEGGPGCGTLEEAIRSGTDETADASFWRAVLAVIRPDKSVHLKSIGGVGLARKISEVASDAGIDTVIVCTDADLSFLPPEEEVRSNLVRTWGYSWESDIADIDVLRCVFFNLRPNSQKARDAFDELVDWHQNFVADCKPYVHEDVRRTKGGCPGVFDRAKPVRNIGESISTKPALDKAFLDERIAQPPGGNEANITLEQVDVLRHCYGKLLAKACYHAVMHFAQTVRRGRIDFDTFVDLSIACLRNVLPGSQGKLAYYQAAIPA